MLVRAASPVFASDYDIQNVMNGQTVGVTAQVNGSGLGYYGNSLRVSFFNNTGQSYTVRVPIGLMMVPADSGVQTMLTAGGEKLTVPPGQSSYTIKAFCGEMHDHSPDGNDVFTPGGFVSGDTLQTLQEINRQERFDATGQEAVWHQTDGNDISDNEAAQQLAGGGGVSPGAAAAAGGATAGVAVLATVLTNLLGGGSSGGDSATDLDNPDGTSSGGDRSPEDDSLPPYDEPVYDDEVFENYTPPEDTERFHDVQPDRSTDRLRRNCCRQSRLRTYRRPKTPATGYR
jgi:hypothetical protein